MFFSRATGPIRDFTIIRGAYGMLKARASRLISLAHNMLLYQATHNTHDVTTPLDSSPVDDFSWNRPAC
jgi:hypothetical protein